MNRLLSLIILIVSIIPPISTANDVLTYRTISMDLARDLADAAIQVCRKNGYSVSVAVVDRSGIRKVLLRDDGAPRFTMQIAEEKANSVILSSIPSGQFRDQRGDIRPELNHLDGIIMMRGGFPINSGGNRIGAIGVSGAPGGEKDEVCAEKALSMMLERLEFAE